MSCTGWSIHCTCIDRSISLTCSSKISGSMTICWKRWNVTRWRHFYISMTSQIHVLPTFSLSVTVFYLSYNLVGAFEMEWDRLISHRLKQWKYRSVVQEIYSVRILLILCVLVLKWSTTLFFSNILRINIYNTLNQHCHCNSLVHTGGVPVNEPSALQLLVRSPAVWLYPSTQVYVTFES